MACLTCVRACRLTKPKIGSTQNLTIGTISDLSTDVYVYAENNQGQIERFETTSTGAGVVTFDLNTAGEFFTGDNDYKIWVTLRTTDISQPLTVSVLTNSFNCVLVKFTAVYDNTFTRVGDSSQSISLDSSSTAPILDGVYANFVNFKGNGNTAASSQAGDWKIDVTAGGDLGAYYFEDGVWKLKATLATTV